jgi:hypothetical protein
MVKRKRKKSDSELAQERINTEADAVKILGIMLRFQKDRSGIRWNNEAIAKFVQLHNVQRAIAFLIKHEFVGKKGDSYYITVEGREFYDSSKKNNHSGRPGDVYRFRVEVLEGITTHGDRTKIDLPVLPPIAELRQREEATPEIYFTLMEKARSIKKKLCDEYSLSGADFDEKYESGLVQLCSECSKIRIFKKSSSDLCMSCEGGKQKHG